MVFYRKYRPQTIEELDSQPVRQTLLTILSAKETPHALLFTGPKGLGKTSTARIVAKYVNCIGKSKEKPCNECEQCISITNGTNIDVLEIDGASNRGIDEMRDLREKIRLLPASANRKVYIIDEVHMLTTEAFNALLKTLEEPPAHAMFILCTTESHKVPATIKSRCFQISFKKATDDELIHSFKRIIKGEKLKATDDALKTVASFSDCSFRDGAKVLEEIVQLSDGKELTKELVEKFYHSTNSEEKVQTLLKSLIKKDVKEGLLVISKAVEEGVDMKFFLTELLKSLHMTLLIKTGIVEGKAEEISFADLQKLASLLSRASEEMKYAVLPQLPLELALVEWSTLEESRIIHSASSEQVNQESRKESVIASPSASLRINSAKQSPDEEINENSPKRGSVSPFPPVNAQSSLASSNALRVAGSPSRAATPKEDKDLWWQFVDRVKAENFSVAGVLRSCRLGELTDGIFTIETPYKFHKERLEDRKTRDLLEKIINDMQGKTTTLTIVLKS